MNPMMRGFSSAFNLKNNFNNLMKNPQGIADFLQNTGRFSAQQIEDIRGMNGNIAQIGQYLMRGVPQNMYGQLQNQVDNLNNQM